MGAKMSIIGEIALVKCKIENMLNVDRWFTNNYYPMQWEETSKLIYRRIRKGQSFEEFAEWFENHPRKDTMKHRIGKWPKCLIEYWDKFFTKEYYMPRPQKPRML
jgi:hypothetical protein